MKLKLSIFVSCTAIISCFVSETKAIMEDNILEFLEEIRNRMCYPLFGFPALDPLQIEHANFSMNNKYVVDFTGSLNDFSLTGFSAFNVTNLKITTVPLRRSHFNLILPLTTVNSLYTAQGFISHIIYLNGNDKAEGHIDDVNLSVSWVLKTGLFVAIRNLKIEISIGDLFVDIGNLSEEPRLNNFLYALINEMGIELLNDLWVEAQYKGVTKYIEDIINKFLGNYKLSDIIKFIGNIYNSEKPSFGGTPADCKTNV